jgi:hypothetical protein
LHPIVKEKLIRRLAAEQVEKKRFEDEEIIKKLLRIILKIQSLIYVFNIR